MITFTQATENQHFKAIETLAHTIWNEHYIPIIGKSQVDYMLHKFQSTNSVKQQIKDGYLYFFN